jgi:hypothetical protein
LIAKLLNTDLRELLRIVLIDFTVK